MFFIKWETSIYAEMTERGRQKQREIMDEQRPRRQKRMKTEGEEGEDDRKR